MVQHASRSGSVPPLTRSSFISAWRAADLRRATALKNRGLLPAGQIAQQDPICQNCGHRAIVHGMQNLPVKDRGRWWRKSSTPCGWRSCQCTDWEPELSARSGADFSCEVRITEAWIEVPLGHSWIVAYRIMNERGTPVLGELRVFPAEDGDDSAGSGVFCSVAGSWAAAGPSEQAIAAQQPASNRARAAMIPTPA